MAGLCYSPSTNIALVTCEMVTFSLLYLSILYNIGDPGRRKLTNEKLNPIIKYTTNYTHTHIEGYVGSDEGYWQRVWCGGGGGKMVW